MWKKLIYERNNIISSILEHFMAILVLIAIIIATFSLKDSFFEFIRHRQEMDAFLEYLGAIFSIVIGIEFFKLLWRPGKETLLEVLMFVLARHMIIDHNTSFENLLSVISIGVLFVIERCFLHGHKTDPDSLEEDDEITIFDK